MTDAHDCDGEIDEGNDHDADVDSPSDTAASAEESRPAKTFRVSAEPPRWRFVADAKKSLGYSSLAAGQYVEGKTSEELGATYVAPEVPEVWLHKAERPREKLEVGKLRLSEFPVSGGFKKEDVEVGKLYGRVCNFIGDVIVGGSGDALDATKEEGNAELKSDMVFDNNNEEGEWSAENSFEEKVDGSTNCSEPSGETRSENLTSQNKGEDQGNNIFDEEATKRARNEDHEATDSAPKKRRRHRFLYLLILLLLVLGVVLGVMLGMKNNGEREGSISQENAATIPDIVTVPAINHTSSRPSSFPSTTLANEPSAMPSLPPSTWPRGSVSSQPSTSTPPSISQQPSESSVPSENISSQPSSSILPSVTSWPSASVAPSISTSPSISQQPSESSVPSISSQPSSSILPSVTSWPSASVAPSFSTSPSNSQQPSESSVPSISSQPSSSVLPSVTGWPSVSVAPSFSTSPSISQQPSDSSVPSISSQPSSSVLPSVTSWPSVSVAPSISTPPSISQQPSESSVPSISSQPSGSILPSVTSWPSVSVAPSISTSPSISQQPSASSVPSISSQPSSSALPTQCMPGTKIFWMENAHDGSSSSAAQDWTNYPNAFKQEFGEGSSSSENEEATFRAIWKVKNACSEEVIDQCPPCSSGNLEGFAQTGLRSNQPLEIAKRDNNVAHHTKQKIVPRRQAPVENIMLCLPDNTEYLFEVQIAPSSQFCCAFPFDPHTVIISYDDEVFSVERRKTYFGKSNTSC